MPLPNFDKNLTGLKTNLKSMRATYKKIEREIILLPDYPDAESRLSLFHVLETTLKLDMKIISRSILSYRKSNEAYEKLKNNPEEKSKEMTFDSQLLKDCERAVASFNEREKMLWTDIEEFKQRATKSKNNTKDTIDLLKKHIAALEATIKIYEKRLGDQNAKDDSSNQNLFRR